VISDAGAGVVVVVISAGRSVVFIVGFFVGGLRDVVTTGFFVVVTAGGFGFVTGGCLVVIGEVVWFVGFHVVV
jgi:hypothetical protein